MTFTQKFRLNWSWIPFFISMVSRNVSAYVISHSNSLFYFGISSWSCSIRSNAWILFVLLRAQNALKHYLCGLLWKWFLVSIERVCVHICSCSHFIQILFYAHLPQNAFRLLKIMQLNKIYSKCHNELCVFLCDLKYQSHFVWCTNWADSIVLSDVYTNAWSQRKPAHHIKYNYSVFSYRFIINRIRASSAFKRNAVHIRANRFWYGQPNE